MEPRKRAQYRENITLKSKLYGLQLHSRFTYSRTPVTCPRFSTSVNINLKSETQPQEQKWRRHNFYQYKQRHTSWSFIGEQGNWNRALQRELSKLGCRRLLFESPNLLVISLTYLSMSKFSLLEIRVVEP